MSTTRDRLDQARQAYRRVRYPGDLADDVFARLDAAERDAFQVRPRTRIASPWRPVLAIAAAVAVLASTVALLVHTGRNDATTPTVARHDPAGPVDVEPTVATRLEATDESNVDFTIVPSYQSFAFSVPTSLTPASIDEYDRQAREASTTTTGEQAATDQGSTSVQ